MTAGAPAPDARLTAALGAAPARMVPLGGGAAGSVARADMPDGARYVVKTGRPGARLDLEGWMLDYLARHSVLPVPAVHHAEADLLVMDYIDGGGRLDAEAETHAADLIAALHAVAGPSFGLERDTLIGPLDQPNGEMESWRAFFRDRRLLAFGRRALDAGGIDGATYERIERLCARLDAFLEEPAHPSLIHGDLWGGNVLARRGRIAGFVDPAIYYAHPEVELAFTTLFATFGRRFFDRYAEHRPLDPGFFEIRRDLYNLYPLLVHATLFGAGYGRQADAILKRAVG